MSLSQLLDNLEFEESEDCQIPGEEGNIDNPKIMSKQINIKSMENKNSKLYYDYN